MPETSAHLRSPPSSDISALVARLSAAKTALEQKLGSGADAVVDSRGHVHLLRWAEVALQQSEDRFRSLIENSTDVITLLAADATVLYDSPSITHVLGYSPTELHGHSFLSFSHPEDQAGAREALLGLCATPRMSVTVALRYKHKDGTYRWLEGAGTNLLDQPGVNAVVLNYRDVTERKRMENMLSVNQRQFQAVFEQAAVGMVIAEGDQLRIVKVNRRLCEMLGYSAEELLQRTSRDITHPDDIPFDLKQAEKIKAGIAWDASWEKRYRKKDGTIVWTRVFVAPLDPANANQTQWIAVIEDISERKRVEETLKTEQVLLNNLLSTSPDHIYFKNRQSHFIRINDKMAQSFGLRSPSDARGKSDFDFFTEEHARRAYEDEQQMIRTGKSVVGIEEKETWPDGRVTWASTTKVALRDADGNLTGLVGISRDITERKVAEGKVREQAALLDTANDAIYVTELDDTLRFWNKGAERVYGWSCAEALGRKSMELISIPSGDVANPVETLLQNGGWSGERRQKTKTGQVIIVFARLALVKDAAGQPASIFVIDTDITEKKQLDARFMQAQRLENLGALASGIAHDLNNVLSPILMASAMLRDKAQTDSERNMLSTIEACAQRGAGIIRQVLTFARGVEGKRIPLQPRHLLSEIAAIAAETFPKNLELEMDMEKELWPVLGDATQLHQVLMNLCVNARDAMPDGGHLGLHAENTDLDDAFALMAPGAKPGPYVRLSISDTGTGIPPELFEKIFDPFFTTKAPGKGTGLGLSTVLGIVRSHDGFIQFKSEAGKGTCFEVYLPAALDAKPAAGPDLCSPPPRGQGELILVVDDEIAIRKVASKLLEVFGYRVVSAADGTEALALFMQHRDDIAVIVTDMLMPGMDGPTFVKVVRRIEPEIRIIGITGVGEGATTEVIESLALSALLTKPFTGASLAFALHSVLQVPPGSKVARSASPWRGVSAAPWESNPSAVLPPQSHNSAATGSRPTQAPVASGSAETKAP